MRFYVIGDPHFKRNNKLQTVPFVESCVKKARESSPDIIVILGDVLHDHNKIDGYANQDAINFIFALMDIAYVYLLIGNHDKYDQRDFLTEEHAFYSLKRTPGITVVDSVIVDEIDGKIYTFVPHVPGGRFMEALDSSEASENMRWQNSTIIFAHQNFQGHSLDSVMKEDSDPWSIELPYVVSGHIHNYQNLPNNVLYVGTPYQQNFDDNSDNSVSLFTVNSKNSKIKHERIRLEGIKKRVKIELTYEQFLQFELPEEYIVKIVVRGTRQENDMAKKTALHKQMKSLERVGYKLVYETIKREIQEFHIDIGKTFKEELLERLDEELLIEFYDLFG